MLNPGDIINNSDDVRELKRALVVNMSAEGTDVSDICKGLRVSDSYVINSPYASDLTPPSPFPERAGGVNRRLPSPFRGGAGDGFCVR